MGTTQNRTVEIVMTLNRDYEGHMIYNGMTINTIFNRRRTQNSYLIPILNTRVVSKAQAKGKYFMQKTKKSSKNYPNLHCSSISMQWLMINYKEL